MNTLLFGILAGLAAAFFSSVSYLVSRHHGTREKQASRRMLIFAHVIMGVFSASAALSIYSLEIFSPRMWTWDIWLPCFISTATYFFGTSAVFNVLKKRMSLPPLLA